jgi:hypothetical protein
VPSNLNVALKETKKVTAYKYAWKKSRKYEESVENNVPDSTS